MSVNIKNAHAKNLHIGPGIITDGLVSWWNAASIRSYPRTGSIWYDLIKKNKNNGSLVNMSETNFSEEDGGVLVFDGSDEYVSIAHDSSLDFGNGSFSVSLWISIDSTLTWSGSGAYSIGKRGLGSLGGFSGWQIRARSTSGGWSFVRTGIDDGTNSEIVFNDGLRSQFDKWYMITLTYDTVQLLLYIDNQVVAANNIAGIGSISNTIPVEVLGTSYYNHVNYGSPIETTAGSVSNIALYNKSLTGDEVRQNWTARQNMYN